jgi:peptidoglycan hydrolase-like protein with peptidoglycan-binding domain
MGRHAFAAGLVALLQLAISSCGEAGTSPAAAPLSPPPRATLVSTDARHQDVEKAQHRLRALGFYHGTTNGTLGPQTRKALAAYQRKLQLPVTGELDATTAFALENQDLLRVCKARGTATADCLGAIRQFYATLQKSDAPAAASDDPTAQNACAGENDAAECAKAVAQMSLWLDGRTAAQK